MNPLNTSDRTTAENKSPEKDFSFSALDALEPGSLDGDAVNTTGSLLESSRPDTAPTADAYLMAKEHALWRRRVIGFGALAAAILIGFILILILHASQKTASIQREDASKRYSTTVIPLAELSANSNPTVSNNQVLSVNGQLNVNNTLVLSPGGQPTTGITGQIYFDQTTNKLTYFDGKAFKSLATSNDITHVTPTTIGGTSGALGLGNGLSVISQTLSNTGVLTLQGESGNVTLSSGGGLVINGTTISNSGLLSLGGQNGDITIGTGLGLSGKQLKNTGVVSATGTGAITVTNDGNGNITIDGPTGSGGGTVSSPGGTSGKIAKFTGVQTIADSLLSDNGTTVTVSGALHVTGAVTLDTPLAVVSGGTGASTASGARTNLGAAASGANNDITSLSGLTTALTVAQGGTGVGTLATNGVIIGNGTSGLTSTVAGASGLCLVSTGGAPTFATCPGSGGVVSVNGLTGTLAINNATGSGAAITINDASAVAKGIASFNATNFLVSSGAVNTVQNIAVSSTPTFAGLTLTSPLGVGSGGTGNNTLTTNGVLVGNGASAVTSTTGTNGQCLVISGVAPTFATCPGSGGVTSVNTQTGAITIQGTNAGSVSTAGGIVTINDATGAVKGLASFNATNFLVASGAVNTVQNIAVTSTPTFGGLNLTTALTVANGGTGSTTAAGARTSLGAAASGANSDITSLSGLTTPLSVAQGGTGANSLTANGIVMANGTSPVSSLTGTNGQCLVVTGTTPSFQTCPGTGGVTSVNGGNGAVTIQGIAGTSVSTVGSAITINDASSTVKGLASFNSTNLTVVSGAVNTVQDIAVTSAPTFAGLTLTVPLAVSSGGTGRSSLTANGVVLGNGASGLNTVTGSNGQCLVVSAGAPTFATCPGVGGVTSINAQTGAVTIQGIAGSSVSTSAGVITINDATSGVKGLASFNSTNFSVSSGAVNTVQDIATTSAPQFGQLSIVSNQAAGKMLTINNTNAAATGNLLDLQLNGTSQLSVAPNGNLSTNGTITSGLINGQTISGTANFTGSLAVAGVLSVNTITPTGALTIGVGSQSFTLQGNASSSLKATSGANTTTVGFQSPTANVTYNFATAAAGAYDVCTTAGNCVGVGGGVTTPGGTTNKIAKFNGSGSIGDSTITDNGSTVTIGGTLSVNTITPTSALTVGSTSQNLTMQGAAVTLSSTSGGISNSLVFATPATSNKTITLPNASGTVAVSASGPLVLDSFGNLTCPTCLSGGGGGSGVSSLNGLSGVLVLQGSDAASFSSVGTTITVSDASATVKGLAKFNSTNLVVTSGSVNTIQDIAVTSTPTFAGLNLTSALTVANGGTGATTAAGARTNLGVAASGANSDITSLSGLTTPLSVAQGGTGVATTPTNGQILIGNGSGFSLNTLTAGSGVTISNASGAITISAPSSGTCSTCATTSLNNLAAVAINTSLLPGIAGGANLGSSTLPFGQLSLAGTSVTPATNNFLITGVSTGGTRTLTLPDASGTFAVSASGNIALSATGNITFTGTLPVLNGGTGSTTAGGARTNLGAAASGANSDITSLSGLTTALSVGQGGTGLNSLIANQLLYANSTSSISQMSNGSSGQCLVSNGAGSAPSFQTCTGAGGVSSLDTLTGALSINNTTGAGATITIDNAKADGATKGIATFNSTNFSDNGSGVINTIQGIATTSTPTFAGLTVNGVVTTNTISPTAALTIGATGQALTLQGSASSTLTATGGGFTTTIGFSGTPTGNVTYNFDRSAAAGSYTICTTVGNCTGGSGGIGGSGTTNTIALFTASGTIGNSLLSQSGSTVTTNGNFNLTTGNQYQINGTQISSANLSNDGNLAKLNATQTFTGGTNTFKNAADSSSAFAVQNAAGSTLMNVDTTSGGFLTISQNQNNVSNILRVGPTNYTVGYLTAFTGSSYLVLDKNNTASDASLVLRDQGAVRAEIGIVTNNDIHFKTATGSAGSETFTDRLIIQSTGDTYTTGKLGVGGAPTEQLHVTASNTSGKVLTKIENTSGSGSGSSGLQLAGGSANWTLSTDIGLNRGNNFAIQDNNFGYQPRLFIDSTGKLGLGTDSPTGSISFASGASRTINIIAPTGTAAGNDLSILAGNGNGTNQAGGNLVLSGGNSTGTGTPGSVVVRPQTNVATAFEVQNAAGSPILSVDTTGSGIVTSYGAFTSGSTVNAVSGYLYNGVAGSTTTCSSGNVLQNAVVQGGIITGGTCIANGGGYAPTLQNVYDNSASPATIALASSKGIIFRDNATSVGNIFQVQDSAGSSTYFNVTSGGIQAAALDTVSAGTLAIGNTNATTVNIATNNSGHTVNIGTGTGIQNVNIGSTTSSSFTTIQGGGVGGGIKLIGGAGNIVLTTDTVSGTPMLMISSSGATTLQPTSNVNSLFHVNNAGGTNLFNIDSTTGITSANAILAGGGGVTMNGALLFNAGSFTSSYTTPLGSSVNTKINFQNYDPGAFGQIIALGLPTTANSTARAITLLDARTGTHQETITVLSPDENQTLGISWQGATNTTGNNGTPMLTTSAAAIALGNSGGTAAFTVTASGSNQTAQIGGSGIKNGTVQFGNSTNSNTTGIQATSVSASYLTNLPTAIGTAGQCLSVASIASTTQTLGYSACLTSASGVQLQAGTPGTQQTGNLNISGIGIFGSALQASVLDSAAAGALNLGTTNATTVALGNTANTTTATITVGTGGNINIGTNGNNKTITLGSSGAVNNTTAIYIGNTISTGGANTIQIGGTGTTSGSNTGSTVTLQGGQTMVSVANAGTTIQTFTNSATAFQVKNAAGTGLLNVDTTTGNTYTTGKLGVGGVPSEQLHVQASSTSAKILTKIENTNAAASSKSSGVQLVGGSINWTLGTDVGLNGGNNFAIQDNTFGYTPRFLIDGSGNIGIGTDSPSASVSFGSGADKTININTNASGNGNNFTLQAGSGGGTNSNGGNLVLQGGAATGSGTGGGVIVKSQTNSTVAFQIQNSGSTALFTADTSGSSITLGNASSGNYISFTAAGGLTAFGTAQHTKSISLSAEYAGAVLYGGDTGGANCSTSQNGTMTSGYDTSSNQMSYYNWTSAQGTNQCYDVIARVAIPSDFSSWNGAPTIKVKTDNTSNSTYAIGIIKSDGSTYDTSYGSAYTSPGTLSTSWANMATSSLDSSGYTAGSYMTVRIRMTAKNNANLQLGDLVLTYNSKF